MDGRACVCVKKRFSEAQWTLLRAAGSLFLCPVNRTSLTRIDNVGQLANPHKPSLRNVYPAQCGGEGLLHLVTNGRARFYCNEANHTLLFCSQVPRSPLSLFLLLFFTMNWMNAKSIFRYCLLPSLLFLLQAFVIFIELWLSGLLVFIYLIIQIRFYILILICCSSATDVSVSQKLMHYKTIFKPVFINII